MRVGEFDALLDKAVFCESSKHRAPLMFVGPAGIGKSVLPEVKAARKGWDYWAINMALANPTFVQGYPFRENGTAGHLPFGVLGKALKATKDSVLALDEFGSATGETVKAALRFVQFREVGGEKLPDCVRIIAMSNDVSHGADVMGIIEPMKDRFRSIVNVEPHIDDTIGFGMSNGWPAWLMAFLRNSPAALHDLKPMKSMQRSGATPRGWNEMALLDTDGLLDSDSGVELAHGAVGKGRATEALAFRRLVGDLPDIDAVLMDPDSAPVPKDPSARFLISMALATRMDSTNFGQCVKYLNRLDAMFRAYSIRDAFRGENERRKAGTLPKNWKALSSSRDFTAWAVSEDGKAVMSAAS